MDALKRNVTQVAFAVACWGPPAYSQSNPTDLKPIWDVAIERGVEWCAPVDGDPASALLLCTKESQLDLIDIETGRSRLPNPHRVALGTRFAGGSDRVAFCYGSSLVYAIDAAPGVSDKKGNTGVLWQVTAAPDAQTEGDPEFMTRLVAAQATPEGVMIVRSDGVVAELDQKRGAVRWKHKLKDIANCTLHLRNDQAALLWKSGAAAHVAFFDLSRDAPKPRVRPLDAAPPIWSALIDRGLVVVWPMRFGVVDRSGRLDAHGFDNEVSPASARCIAVCESRGDSTSQAYLLVRNWRAEITAINLCGGDARWSARLSSSVPDSLRRVAADVRCVGGLLMVTSVDGARVWEAQTGRFLAMPIYNEQAAGAGVAGDAAYALSTRIVDARFRSGPASLVLHRQMLAGDDVRVYAEHLAPRRRLFQLGSVGEIRDTFWLGGALVIVEDQRVRAYTLP